LSNNSLGFLTSVYGTNISVLAKGSMYMRNVSATMNYTPGCYVYIYDFETNNYLINTMTSTNDSSVTLPTEVKASHNPGYICNISESDSTLHVLRDVYEVDKIYYINPKTYYTNADLLNKLDATTIDYVKSIGKVNNRNILIIKYKKVYEDGTYEVFHSKVEV
jgi:hypothetical protein